MKTALVLGGHGFIGHHLCRRLKNEGYWVRSVDIQPWPVPDQQRPDEELIYDLRESRNVMAVMILDFVLDTKRKIKAIQSFQFGGLPFTHREGFDEVYQLAADMGGAGYVFTGEHDADIMSNSAQININVCHWAKESKVKKIFYSSSACMYPQEKQIELNGADRLRGSEFERQVFMLSESDAYPANPDSEYGWEKLFSERLYLAYARNYGLNVRIARFHNIYGPEGTYKGGREKAPAAMCRKVVESIGYKPSDGGLLSDTIEVWGDGQQTRSFLYIDDCIDAVRLLMQSDFKESINIGSEEMVSINELAQMAIDLSGKYIKIKNIPSNALGVRGRNSDNTLIRKILNWEPKYSLKEGLTKTFNWISEDIGKDDNDKGVFKLFRTD